MTTWPPDYGPRLPLWDAVYKQNGALVTNILASVDGRTQVNVAHGMWRQTCVHLAVQKGNLKILKMLLFVNADANARMINGTTPLHLAIQTKRKDMLECLLLVGGNPLLRNHTNQTVIEMARDMKMFDVVPLLVQAANGLPIQRALKKQQEETHKMMMTA